MADKPEELLTIQQQINKVLNDRLTILKSQESALMNQVQLAVDLCKSLKCEQLDDIEERLKSARDAMAAAAEEAGRFGTGLEESAGKGEKSVKSLDEAMAAFRKRLNEVNPALKGFMLGLGGGLVKGVGSAWESIKNLNSMLFNVIKTLGGLALAIISIPFKIFQGIFELAQGSGGGPSPVLVELENIRKQFGNLATNEGRALKHSLVDIRDEYSNVAKSGLSIRKIFGTGMEGIAKYLEYNRELAEAMGTAFNGMMNIIKENSPELAIYRKGMGMTAEHMAMVMKLSSFAGKKPMETLRQFASMSLQMGAKFGVNAKLISRSMGEMASDLANFGNLGPKALGSIATYAHKLGIEIKDLVGVISAFDDFDTAAQNAAKLAQSLNMNVDTMQLLEEQDPAARYALLQRAMRESGKTYADLNRQEKKQLSTLTSIPEAAAAAAFGTRGMSMSYKEMQAESAKAEKKVMSQEEAMQKLAKSIERVFPSGGGSKFKSFFDAFASGFRVGIMRSIEFRRAMRALRRSIREVFWSGRRVGRMFVKEFPGVKQMLVAFRDVFSPKRFREMMKGVEKAFSDLFRALKTDPKAGVLNFIKDFKNILKNFFSRTGPGVAAFLDGGKQFLKALYGIFQAVFPLVIDGIANAMNAITEFLKNPPDLQTPISKALSNLFDAIAPLFIMIADKLSGPFAALFSILWEKAKPYVMQWAGVLLKVALTKIFINAIWGAFVGAIGGAAGKIAAAGIMKLVSTLSGLKKIPAVDNAPGSNNIPAPKPDASGSLPGSGASGSWGRFFVYIGAILLVFAAVVAIYEIADLKPMDAIAIAGVIVAIVGSSALMSNALKALPSDLKVSEQKLVQLGIFMGVIGGITLTIVSILSAIPSGNLLATVPAFMGVMLSLVIAAIPMVIMGAIMGKMSSQIVEATLGMAVLGWFMAGVGILGVAIVGALSQIPNTSNVAPMMFAISAMMVVTMMMLPVAIALGALASSGIGAVGLLVILGGFEMIAALSLSLVGTLMPAIKELSKIQISNPSSFKAVTEALVSIMDAVNKFVMALSGLAFMIQPSILSFDGSTFEGNIKEFKRLVDSLMKSGVNKILSDLMRFAKTASVKEGTADAISAIGSTLAAVAGLIGAFAPDGEIIKGMTAELGTMDAALILAGPAGWAAFAARIAERSSAVTKILDAMKTFQGSMGKQLTEMLPALGSFIKDVISSVGSVPASAKDVAPLISALGPIFNGVAALMNALSPSDASWNALSNASASLAAGPGARADVQATFDETALRKIKNFPTMLENIKIFTVEIIKGIKGPIVDMLTALSGVSVENLKIVIPLVSSVIEFAVGVASGIGPLVSSAASVSESAPEGERSKAFADAMTKIKDMMWNVGPVLTTMIEPLKGMIMAVIKIASSPELKNVKGLKGKIEVVTAALGAIGEMSKIFSVGGPLSQVGEDGKINESMISGISESMGLVTRLLLNEGGTFSTMVKALVGMKITDGRQIKSSTAGIKSISEAMGEIAAEFRSDSGIVKFGSTTFGGDPGLLIDSIQQKIRMFTVGNGAGIFEGMKAVADTIPEGVANRSESIRNMVANLESISTSLRTSSITGEELTSIVQLTNALNGSGNLTVAHKNLNITMNVEVHMSAEQIASGIIKVNDINTGLPGKQRFAIETT